MCVKKRPDKLAADVFQPEFKMRVLVDGVVAAVKRGGADVEALLVGDFFRRDQARGVAGARGGNGGVEWMGESIAEGDARRCGFDKFARTRAVKHARLCSHVGKVFYTGAKDLTERTRQSQTEPERAWRPQRKEQRKCGTDLLVCPRGSIAHKEER